MKRPSISVVLPVYNAAKTLPEALASLVEQSFTDFEIVAVDNGSTDESKDILETWASRDVRLRVFHEEKRGIVPALNRALQESQSDIIARMDADDICALDRLEIQYVEIQRDPDLVVLGGQVRHFGDEVSHTSEYPQSHGAIRAACLFENPMSHPTVVVHRGRIDGNALIYREGFTAAEDYELWARLALKYKVKNLNTVVLQYRNHATQSSRVTNQARKDAVNLIQQQYLEAIGLKPSEDELKTHAMISGYQVIESTTGFIKVADWLEKIRVATATLGDEEGDAWEASLQRHWWRINDTRKVKSLQEPIKFMRSALSGRRRNPYYRSGRKQWVRMAKNLWGAKSQNL